MTIIKTRSLAVGTELAAELHPVLQRIYAGRGITSAQAIDKSFQELLPYEQLRGIDVAARLLGQSVMQQQRIMIIGDFDTDGATSTALAVTALRAMGAQQVNFLVPNRFEYGYGLTPDIVAVASDMWQPDLIVTVDNGIASLAGVEAAKSLGMQVLITDHHLPGDELPAADAIVNPNQPDCPFPSKNLAGVGVIFYVMLALRAYLRQQQWFQAPDRQEPNMGRFLDLVALGTVADVVPLDQNNRILVHQGLQRIAHSGGRPGIQALLNLAKRDYRRICAQDLGFAIAPRLNAAGRLDDMSLGIVCLLSEDLAEATAIAEQLDCLNEERKQLEADMSQQAFGLLQQLTLGTEVPAGVCLYHPDWHQGVVGILSSRVKEKYYRPVIAFAKVDDRHLKGSARSIPGIHIRDSLDQIATQHPELIEKFGGHAMAAGLTLREDRLADFRLAFENLMQQQLTPEIIQDIRYSDGELAPEDFNLSLAELLRHAEPWGQGFPEPLFEGTFKLIDQRIVGVKHLKLVLGIPQQDRIVDAIAFNVDLEQWPNHRANHVKLLYRLEVNEFRGRRSLQLMCQTLEPSMLEEPALIPF